MWVCQVCKVENEDSLRWCQICGTEPGATGQGFFIEKVPRKVRKRSQLPPAAGVTRRFGIRTMMAITVFFAVLFSFLKTVGAVWEIYLFISLYIVGVGIGQALLFPRPKSRAKRRWW